MVSQPLFRPEEILALCSRLVKQAREQIQAQTSIIGVRRILVARAAARLPGFTPALEQWLHSSTGAVVEATPVDSSDDFGADLIPGGNEPIASDRAAARCCGPSCSPPGVSHPRPRLAARPLRSFVGSAASAGLRRADCSVRKAVVPHSFARFVKTVAQWSVKSGA